ARPAGHARARSGIRRFHRPAPPASRRIPRAGEHPDPPPRRRGGRMIRVLIVDDHAMLRAGFRTILGTQPDIKVVGEAATGAEGVELAARLHPDVITMDVQMPDMNGIEATRRIVADATITASVAIITTFDRDEYLFQALDAGAGGFLLKNAGPEELITAVRALAVGDGVLAPEVTRRVLARFTASAPPSAPAPPRVSESGSQIERAPVAKDAGFLTEPLTEREGEVLTLM